MAIAVAVVALLALLPIAWLYDARSSGRWRAALDGYAEREIARDQRRNTVPPQRVRTGR